MSDWYCAKKFEIPLDKTVLIRGAVTKKTGEKDGAANEINHVKITEWKSLDEYEPTREGEENGQQTRHCHVPGEICLQRRERHEPKHGPR